MTKESPQSTPKSDDVAASADQGKDDNLANAASNSAGRTAWMGTAVGIGSAAIVAALIYAKKRK